ncbi:MAG: hypothetical protein HUJ77_05910 [Clostridium sp.]|uniref:hypothetical protein n=1 Tax=Clostridium sp. TaxID=1506 RepID=UPI0025C18F45|nr:hypothetical protein [Clostridium sp.]MCF0147917.1 hypothetical protein [Clostridium sp.]
MRYQFERNLKIINELMTYLHKLGAKNINVKFTKNDSTTDIDIWGEIITMEQSELDNLINLLNTDRQHEIEEYYWNLDSDAEENGDFTLIGMMIDKADVTYSNNILSFKICRNEI